MSDVQVLEEKEPLFSKKNKKLISDPIGANNPITVQVLGVCSALAVTVQVKPSFFMALGVIVVTTASNLIVSLIRNIMPPRIRMIVQLAVIAMFVILVSEVLEAFVYDIFTKLSVFIGLIITNCIVMGRLEAFAMANKPWPSTLDGIGNGVGYGLILIVVAVFREIFGAGKLFIGTPMEIDFGTMLIENGINWTNNGVMLMPSAAMFLIGIYIWIQRARNKELVDIS